MAVLWLRDKQLIELFKSFTVPPFTELIESHTLPITEPRDFERCEITNRAN